MAARSIASLTLSFGLVSIPVKLYSATESSGAVRFNLLDKDGSRVRQQYVSEKTGKVVERSQMVKGYEFEKDHFVLFTPEELKALDETASHVIDIVAFVPVSSVDPIFYDRAYFLARTSAAASRIHCWSRRCARAGVAHWRGGHRMASSTWCRCGRPTTVWCCSSCCTPPRCARCPSWGSRRPP
jgi:DNA end-binding protein Ku